MTTTTKNPFADLPLDTPIPIPDVARRAQVRTKRMRRWLMKIHRDTGTLLVRSGVSERAGEAAKGERYLVRIPELQKHWPDFGKKFCSPDEVEQIVDDRLRGMRRDIRALQARTREVERFQQLSLGWFERAQERPGEPSGDSPLMSARTQTGETDGDVVVPSARSGTSQ